MGNNSRASRLAKHELHRAYEIIFGRDTRGGSVILEQESLARAFRERAYQFRPDRAQELGKPKRELREAVKAVAVSFDLLAEVLGPDKRVWVSCWVDNTRTDRIQPWAPTRTIYRQQATGSSQQKSNSVEEASRRIKEAISKLKEQTEALAKNRRDAEDIKSLPPRPQSPKPAAKSIILGRHLHRRGLISLRQLIAAVAWQRQQRPAVGQIAKSWGILTDDQILLILREKESGELFCNSAVRRGLMTPFQRLAVVGRQRVMQRPIGQYFIEQGILSEKQIAKEVENLRASQNMKHAI